jgi:hypothetical protein
MTRTMTAGLILALSVTQALATPDQPSAPATIMLPTYVVSGMRQYLGGRPYDETAGLIATIERCWRAQVPVNGVTRSGGECPEVAAALRAREDGRPKAGSPPQAPADAPAE